MMKLLKYFGATLGVLVLALAGFLYFTVYDYPTYSLKADKSKFPHVKTAEDIEQLAEDLVSQMTLDEKVQHSTVSPLPGAQN